MKQIRMTMDDMKDMMDAVMPNGQLCKDCNGQYVIYTGLKDSEDVCQDTLADFYSEDISDE